MSDWNGFDWVLVIITAFSIVMAFRRGLIRAIFGLLGFVGGFQAATWSYSKLGGWINDAHVMMSPQIARIVAFLVVVVAIAVGFEFLGQFLQRKLRDVGFSAMDRLLGAAFGFARGCLVGIALLMATSAVLPESDLISRSVLSPYLFAVAHDVSFLVPQYFQRLMADSAFDIRQNPPHWINGH